MLEHMIEIILHGKRSPLEWKKPWFKFRNIQPNFAQDKFGKALEITICGPLNGNRKERFQMLNTNFRQSNKAANKDFLQRF